MSGPDILRELRDCGVQVTLVGEKLRLDAPRGVLTAELRGRVAERKDELRRLLGAQHSQSEPGHATGCDHPEVAWRVDAMRPHVPKVGPIPSLMARPMAEPISPDQCLSCGEPLPPGNRYSCNPCVQAMWRVLDEVRDGT